MASFEKSQKCCATCTYWDGKTEIFNKKVFCHVNKAKCKKNSCYGETFDYSKPCSGWYWKQKYEEQSKQKSGSSGDVAGSLLLLGAGLVGLAIDNKLKKNQERKKQSNIKLNDVFKKNITHISDNQDSKNNNIKINDLFPKSESKDKEDLKVSREETKKLLKALFGNN